MSPDTVKRPLEDKVSLAENHCLKRVRKANCSRLHPKPTEKKLGEPGPEICTLTHLASLSDAACSSSLRTTLVLSAPERKYIPEDLC